MRSARFSNLTDSDAIFDLVSLPTSKHPYLIWTPFSSRACHAFDDFHACPLGVTNVPTRCPHSSSNCKEPDIVSSFSKEKELGNSHQTDYFLSDLKNFRHALDIELENIQFEAYPSVKSRRSKFEKGTTWAFLTDHGNPHFEFGYLGLALKFF